MTLAALLAVRAGTVKVGWGPAGCFLAATWESLGGTSWGRLKVETATAGRASCQIVQEFRLQV